VSAFDPETLEYLNLAVELERNTNKFYKTALEKIKDPDTKSVLHAVTEHESGHLESIARVRDLYAAKQTDEVKAAAAELEVHKPTNPFTSIEQVEKMTVPGADILDLFEQAIAFEKKANEFYLEAAEHAQGTFIQAYLKKLAKEEIFHMEWLQAQKEAVCTDGHWLSLEHVTLDP